VKTLTTGKTSINIIYENKKIGIYGIICGLVGMGLWIFTVLLTEHHFNSNLIIVSILFFVLNMLTLIAGGLLYQEKKIGISIFLISQVFQIFQIEIEKIKYSYSVGPFLNFTFGEKGYFEMSFDIFALNFHLAITDVVVDSVKIGLNVIPIVIIVILLDKFRSRSVLAKLQYP
jgi:hypothetical protein